MIGEKFFAVQVIERVPTPKGKNNLRGPYYRCHCFRCGNDQYVATSGDLRSGRIKSCGCLRNSEEHAQINITHGQRRQKKGETSRTYTIWAGMKKRCDNPSAVGYKYYGGRGITYCKEWEKFENFYKDMGEAPEGLSLDRIDTNGHYHKDNCRWATAFEQVHNRNPNGYLNDT